MKWSSTTGNGYWTQKQNAFCTGEMVCYSVFFNKILSNLWITLFLGAMDTFARGLRNAAHLIKDGVLDGRIKVRLILYFNLYMHICTLPVCLCNGYIERDMHQIMGQWCLLLLIGWYFASYNRKIWFWNCFQILKKPIDYWTLFIWALDFI